MRDEVKRRNVSTRYGLPLAKETTMEMLRGTDELTTVGDCAEEILFAIVHAFTVVPLIEDTSQVRDHRGALYDYTLNIIKRAQELPREGDPGSSLPTG